MSWLSGLWNRNQPFRVAGEESNVLAADDARHRGVRPGLVFSVTFVDDRLERYTRNGEAACEGGVDPRWIGGPGMTHSRFESTDHFEPQSREAAARSVAKGLLVVLRERLRGRP